MYLALVSWGALQEGALSIRGSSSWRQNAARLYQRRERYKLVLKLRWPIAGLLSREQRPRLRAHWRSAQTPLGT